MLLTKKREQLLPNTPLNYTVFVCLFTILFIQKSLARSVPKLKPQWI